MTVLARLPAGLQWTLLAAASGAVSFGLAHSGLPAASFLGPLAAAIAVGVNGGSIRMPAAPFMAAQAVIGALVARSVSTAALLSIVHHLPLFLFIVLATIGASSAAGWLLARFEVLPGTTGIWGSSPGAASAMILMSEAFGGDARLVAFMQYLRVVFVAIGASFIGRFRGVDAAVPAHPFVLFPPMDWAAFALASAVIAAGAFAGYRLKLPAGVLLGALIAGSAFEAIGVLRIELPPWLLIPAYAAIGWSIGLRFTRDIVLHASRALPAVALSILFLMAFCGALAAILTVFPGIDPLTAYLATSPGGLDSAAIIAASANVDMGFVMALQTVRIFVVLIAGPPIARFIVSKSGLH